MKRVVAILYHRVDFDGILSFAIVRAIFLKMGWEVVAFPLNHNEDEPSLDELSAFDAVVIVDIALSGDLMKGLYGMRSNGGLRVIWNDHHASSIADSVKGGWSGLDGIREEGVGACELTWRYFHPGEEAPRFVALLSAYDVWDKKRFDWEAETLPFQYGMRQAYSNDAAKFCAAFDDGAIAAGVERVTEDGRLILSYARQSGRQGVKTYGFGVTVGGKYQGVCCLTNQYGALAFDEALRESGATIAVCANRRGPDDYYVSVFGTEANRLNLGAYMKKHYRGGGHFNAAGGKLNTHQFIRLITECEL